MTTGERIVELETALLDAGIKKETLAKLEKIDDELRVEMLRGAAIILEIEGVG